MFWRKFCVCYLLYMRCKLGYLLTFCTPNMHQSILATWYHVIWVRSEGTLNHWRLVEKVGKPLNLITLKSIKKDDTIVCSSKHKNLSIVAELHAFDLVVIFSPVSEGSCLAITDSIKTNSNNLFVFLLNRPCHSETYSSGIEVGNGVVWHALWFHI